MKHIIRAVMVGSLVFLGSPTLHAVFTIDSFNTTQTTITVTGMPPGPKSAFSFSNAVTSEVVGGQRDIFLERTTDGSVDIVTLSVNIGVPGALSFATPLDTAGRATIVWDGIDGLQGTNFSGLGGLNLTQGGQNNQFVVRRGSDLGASLTFSVFSSEANFSVATIAVGVSSPLSEVFIPFSSFTVGGGSGANFGNVGAISLLIDGTAHAGTDVIIDYFAAIPEPSCAALGLLGACGLALGRRRRRS